MAANPLGGKSFSHRRWKIFSRISVGAPGWMSAASEPSSTTRRNELKMQRLRVCQKACHSPRVDPLASSDAAPRPVFFFPNGTPRAPNGTALMGAVIRQADLDRDRDALIRTHQRYLNPLADSRRYDWLYRDSPFGQALTWLAVDGEGEIVGSAALFPRV